MPDIQLISGPRNISTALMYVFHHHGRFEVVDEPFYGHYLKKHKPGHPGEEMIKTVMETDPQNLIRQILNPSPENKYWFIKNMGHHIVDFPLNYIEHFTNVFLIRDPKKVINSFSKVIPSLKRKDLGVDDQLYILKYLESKNLPFIVINSDDLLEQPELYLKTLCKKLNIVFSASMMQWAPGAIPQDGIWSGYWYNNVHASTGIHPKPKQEINVKNEFISLYKDLLPAYNYLNKHSIRLTNVTKSKS